MELQDFLSGLISSLFSTDPVAQFELRPLAQFSILEACWQGVSIYHANLFVVGLHEH